jgi:hypothetical protein
LALEEFLHGTQQELGILDPLGRNEAEANVRDFMIRHRGVLGISDHDTTVLIQEFIRYSG